MDEAFIDYLISHISGSKYWFVREDPTHDLTGPYDRKVAEENAQAISRDKDRSGIAEVCVFKGYVPHLPPPPDPRTVETKYIYMKGRLMLQGKAARFNSGLAQEMLAALEAQG